MDVFPERLRRLRKKKGVAMQTVSELCGLRPKAISNYENGKEKPSLDTMAMLAVYFGVTMDYLYGLSDNPKSNDGNHS